MAEQEEQMKAKNIKWDVNINDVADYFVEKVGDDPLSAAEAIQMTAKKLMTMTAEEQREAAYDYFRHCPGAAEEFLGLPDEIEIPNPEDPDWTDETVSEYISEITGYCHEGFEIER